MKILITGGEGQLAYDLIKELEKDHELAWYSKEGMDITNKEQCEKVIAKDKPDIVINTAAFHNVDECEKNPQKAFEVNAFGVKKLAEICKKSNTKLVHVSTDYVFGDGPAIDLAEHFVPTPMNVYGLSKYLGEQFVERILKYNRFLIVRTSGLFGVKGPSGKPYNFIDLMLKLAKEGKPIKVVNDQQFCPTFTEDLAKMLKKAIENKANGFLHLAGGGDPCTWFKLAKFAIKQAGLEADIKPQTTEESGAIAIRPIYSALTTNHEKYILRDWKEAVKDYLVKKEEYEEAKTFLEE